MERLTKRELDETTKTVLCYYNDTDCNDGCMNGMCKWNDKALLKLKEYEDAEEQGLLLRLPCKPKSIVYWLNPSFAEKKNKPFKCEIDEFIFDDDCYAILNGLESGYMLRRFRAIKICDFGKIVFLTKEEAEKKLAEIKGE